MCILSVRRTRSINNDRDDYEEGGKTREMG